MSATGRLHGIKALVYVDGTELVGATGYTLNIARDSAEGAVLGATWKTVKGGALGASGSIAALLEDDNQQLFTAATKGPCSSANIMIYPRRTDITCVITCATAYFGVNFAGDSGSLQTNPGDFVVDGAVTLTGFS